MNKAAFLDVDGTLTTGISSWAKVHNHFGVIEQMQKHTDLFYSGKIDYNEWAYRDVQLWKGQSADELYNALLPPDLVKNAKKGVNRLKDHGFDIILVSGGLDILVNEVAKEVEADASFSNTIGHTNGRLDGSVKIGVGLSKAKILRELSQRNNYMLSDCLAMGDNVNDIDMFGEVQYAFAVNSSREDVIAASQYSLQSDDFDKIVKDALEFIQNGK